MSVLEPFTVKEIESHRLEEKEIRGLNVEKCFTHAIPADAIK